MLYLILIVNLLTMNESQKTLRELDVLDVTYHALYIEYLELVVSFELKYGLIYLLLKFSGLVGEDLHRYLKKFQVACFTPMKPGGGPYQGESLSIIASRW